MKFHRILWSWIFLWTWTGMWAQQTGYYTVPRDEWQSSAPDSIRTYTGFYPGDFTQWDTYHLPEIKVRARWLDYLLNKPLWEVQTPDYGFRVSPLLWLEAGKINDSTATTFINTRGVRVEGYVGRQVRFGTEIYENQARFPSYEYRLFRSRQTGNGFPAIVPEYGIAKLDNDGVLDFPKATGYVRYQPSKYFVFQLGHGQPFIGYGYRSLFLSDQVPPYGYFRIESRFWHLRYIVMWSVLQDVRYPLVTPASGVYYRKYMATHYIDWAVTSKWNIGLFENVIWDPANDRGFDLNFLNPVIFFKTLELQTGTKTANTVLGIESRYRLPRHTSAYFQFLLDEMTVSKFFGDPGYWANKYAFQAGVHTVQQWGEHRLSGRLEYNFIRPFTYSHHRVTINYGHDNWSLAHPWGANLKEWIWEFKWGYRRWGAKWLLDVGWQGVDFPDEEVTYGGDIYRDYEERYASSGVYTLNGNLYKRFYSDWQIYWTVNPVYRLQLFAGWNMRRYRIDEPTEVYRNADEQWIYAGLRTYLFEFHRSW